MVLVDTGSAPVSRLVRCQEYLGAESDLSLKMLCHLGDTSKSRWPESVTNLQSEAARSRDATSTVVEIGGVSMASLKARCA